MNIRMRCLVLSLVLASGQALGAGLPPPAPERPLWLRVPSVSPDGSRIAFAHGGQIWVVPSAGGEAIALTSGPHFSHHPVWSPDGQRIAFASRRHGNDDVFVMPAAGGAFTRLSFHSAADVPQAFSPDGREVLFTSARLGSPQADALDVAKPLGGLQQLYGVPATGGRPTMLLPTSALRGAQRRWPAAALHRPPLVRERMAQAPCVGGGARRPAVRRARRQPPPPDRLPRRGPQCRAEPAGDAVLWLSERSGSFNVWRQPLAGGQARQITFHQGQPVRLLSSARDGSLVYSYAGKLWRVPAAATQPHRVPVRIRQGNLMAGPSTAQLAGQATEFAVSPTAPELAVVVRGEVFVVSTQTGQARRIATTAAEERHPSFAPDGRTLLCASERNGRWLVTRTGCEGSAEVERVDAAGPQPRRTLSQSGFTDK
jgi:tricorn protease